MHLLIDDKRHYSVDMIARTARDGKRALRENAVTVLYVDHDLGDGESGYEVLDWARRYNLLPPNIVLLANSARDRQWMMQLLANSGFRSADGFRFLKVQ